MYKEDVFEISSVQLRSGGITIEWTDTGDKYNLFREDELIYSGQDNQFMEDELIPGEVCIYTLERIKNDIKDSERLKLQVTTGPKARNPDNILQEMSMAAIVSSSYIELIWEEIEDVKSYDIFRNGEKVEQVEGPRFMDRNVEKDQAVTYWIKAKRPLKDSEESFKKEKSAIAKVIGAVTSDNSPKETAMEEFWFIKMIGSPGELLKQKPDDVADDSGCGWSLRYTTFLGEKWLENPNVVSLHRYFTGDGRGFDPESSAYRTRADITLNFSNTEPDVELKGSVGKTKSYNVNKEFKEEDTASKDGIVLENIRKDNDNILFTISHSVGNPLVTSPDVNYEVHAVFNRNGYFDIDGKHDQSPNHEVYIKNAEKNEWEMIHQAENKGLEWMAAPLANQHWRSSNFQ